LSFHFTFWVSLQVNGGVASVAWPFAGGPRHCGQVPTDAAEAVETSREPAAAISKKGFMEE